MSKKYIRPRSRYSACHILILIYRLFQTFCADIYEFWQPTNNLLVERMDWSRISSKSPQPSSGHSATVVGKSIYYFGGRNHSTFTNQIVRFDTGKKMI